MIASSETLVAVKERTGARVIALPQEPQRRDFLKVLCGNFVPKLRVYRDPTPFDDARFLFGSPDPRVDYGCMKTPTTDRGRTSPEEELAIYREMAGVPSPV